METKKTMPSVILDGETLTLDQVMVVAYGQPGQPKVELSPQAKARVKRTAEAVEQMLAQGQIAYGITTGFLHQLRRFFPGLNIHVGSDNLCSLSSKY